MPRIAIFKEMGGVKLGDGSGPFDKREKTAAIHAWINKAGLQVGKVYALDIDGKSFATATCSAVAAVSPFAQFAGVE